jgi:Mg-chelatase subunit ChlD
VAQRPTAETLALLSNRATPSLGKALLSPAFRLGLLAVLIAQEGSAHDAAILEHGRDATNPFAQIQVLAWIEKAKRVTGRATAEVCVRSNEPRVARAAVRTLLALDDPQCVAAMIEARANATGLLAEELELALYRFTGRKFFGAGAGSSWKEWWKANGKAYLQAPPTERHDAVEIQRKARTRFYGIPTRSDRIVFAIDGSGSMTDPIPAAGEGAGLDHVAGKTRYEVALNRLRRSIQSLPKHARFSIVLFGGGWRSWPLTGGTAAATDEAKAGALRFLDSGAPGGTTPMFEALDRARWYGQYFESRSVMGIDAADTVYLLSDGSPSDKKGKPLSKEAASKRCDDFLTVNREHQKLVIHTIGVGPTHDAPLLKRIAKETGGTYRAVAMK